MLVNAEANGKRFQEMHVDGGVTAPVMTLPDTYLLRNASISKVSDLQIYILINNKIEPDFQLVTNRAIDIAARSSSTIVKAQTRSILYSTYALSRRNRYGFNLTYIEGDRPGSPSAGFDTAYMRALFDYGHDRARANRLWSNAPPSDDPGAATIPPTTRHLASGN